MPNEEENGEWALDQPRPNSAKGGRMLRVNPKKRKLDTSESGSGSGGEENELDLPLSTLEEVDCKPDISKLSKRGGGRGKRSGPARNNPWSVVKKGKVFYVKTPQNERIMAVADTDSESSSSSSSSESLSGSGSGNDEEVKVKRRRRRTKVKQEVTPKPVKPKEIVPPGGYYFLDTNRGGRSLVLNGYCFYIRKRRTNQMDSEKVVDGPITYYYGCISRPCRACCILRPDGQLEIAIGKHSHTDKHERIIAMKGRRNKLARALEEAFKLNIGAPLRELYDTIIVPHYQEAKALVDEYNANPDPSLDNHSSRMAIPSFDLFKTYDRSVKYLMKIRSKVRNEYHLVEPPKLKLTRAKPLKRSNIKARDRPWPGPNIEDLDPIEGHYAKARKELTAWIDKWGANGQDPRALSIMLSAASSLAAMSAKINLKAPANNSIVVSSNESPTPERTPASRRPKSPSKKRSTEAQKQQKQVTMLELTPVGDLTTPQHQQQIQQQQQYPFHNPSLVGLPPGAIPSVISNNTHTPPLTNHVTHQVTMDNNTWNIHAYY